MRNRAYGLMLLTLGLSACGSSEGDDDTTTQNMGYVIGEPVDTDGDGTSNGRTVDSDGDGVIEGVDTNMDGLADVPLPPKNTGAGTGGATAGTSTGSTPTTTGGTGGTGSSGTTGNIPIMGGSGGSTGGGGGGTGGVVVMTKVSMNCGGKQTDIDASAGYTCCEKYTPSAWSFDIKAVGQCTAFTIPPFSQMVSEEEVSSTCDDKSDCGGGSFCCFFRGMNGPPSVSGIARPLGRKCLSEASCNAGGLEGAAGVFSCSTSADCPASKECIAEPSGVTNANGKPRPWVKICK